MSLATGRGPLGGKPAGVFNHQLPEGLVYVEPYQRRVRALVGGKTVVDSERVVLVHRPGALVAYGFAAEDVDGVPSTPVTEAPGFVTVAWDTVDAWFEEGQPVTSHPRSPYHRIDCLPSARHLVVRLGDTVLVDSTETIVLYETGLAPRLYVHPRDVMAGALVPSETTTYCPYKGTASHWSAVVGDQKVTDAAWSYEDPFDESKAIAGLVSFYDTGLSVETDLPAPVDLH